MAQLTEDLTYDFCSSHDFRVVRLSPMWGSAALHWAWNLLKIPFLPPSLSMPFYLRPFWFHALSQKNKNCG